MTTRYLKINIISLCCLFTLGSCDQGEDVTITLDTVEDGMHLTATPDTVVLSREKMDDTAVTFSWDPPQTRKNNGTVTCYLKLGLAGMTTVTGKIELTDSVYRYSISNWDLNSIAHDDLGVAYGNTITLEAELIADSEGDYFVKPEISTTELLVTTFELAPVNLYLVGTANPDGAELSDGIKLTEIVEGKNFGNEYEWEGDLQAGTFRFVNSLTEDEGSWSMGSDSTILVENEAGSSPDAEFTVTKPGWYSVVLDKSEGKITYGYKGFSHIWGVGLGIGIAWSMPSDVEFSWSADHPNIFTLECTTEAGQDFKLPYNDESGAWNSPFLRPVAANADIWEDNRVQATPAGYGTDLKWLVTEDQAGECLITIDTYRMTISLEKLE